MPAYPWLANTKLDTSLTARKVKILGYGYDGAEVARQLSTFRQTVAAPSYPSAQARSQVTPAALRGEITELDAMVAYLQKLGRDLKAAKKPVAGSALAGAAETTNPYAGSREAEEEGEKIFKENCRSCHGEKGAGGFGPKLAATAHKFGGADGDLFSSIAGGRPGGMPGFLPQLGKERVWKAVAYIRHLEKENR
jgi:mono/diheme cytochrome c family protein